MAGLPAELECLIGFRFVRLAHLLHSRIARAMNGHGLTPKHVGMVRLLVSRGPLHQTEIAEISRADRTTVMQLIDQAERVGMVRRRPDPKDRRANSVSVTPAGERWLDEVTPRVQQAEAEFLAPLSESERRQLHTLLGKLLSAHWSP